MINFSIFFSIKKCKRKWENENKKYNLAIMSIEHELVDTNNFENVINDFASQKAHNVRF